MYSIEFAPKAEKAFRKLERNVQKALQEKIDTLIITPRGINTKKLQGGYEMYRLRVGNYRIVYSIQDKKLIILVLHIGHRKDIYKFLDR